MLSSLILSSCPATLSSRPCIQLQLHLLFWPPSVDILRGSVSMALSCSFHILCPRLSSRALNRPLRVLSLVNPIPLTASRPSLTRPTTSTEAWCVHRRRASSLPATYPSGLCLCMVLFSHSPGFKPKSLLWFFLLPPPLHQSSLSHQPSAFDGAQLSHFPLIQAHNLPH